MSHMTKLPGIPDSTQAIDGMAYFAGTGPEDKTCGDCAHRGYRRDRLHETWDDEKQVWFLKNYCHRGCEIFRNLAGHHGPVVKAHNPSCKFFTQKVEVPQRKRKAEMAAPQPTA